MLSLLTVSHSGLRVFAKCLDCKTPDLSADFGFTIRLWIYHQDFGFMDLPSDFGFMDLPSDFGFMDLPSDFGFAIRRWICHQTLDLSSDFGFAIRLKFQWSHFPNFYFIIFLIIFF